MFNPAPQPFARCHFHKSAFREGRLNRRSALLACTLRTVTEVLLQLSAPDEGNSLLESEVIGGNRRKESVMGTIMAVLTPHVKFASSSAPCDKRGIQYNHANRKRTPKFSCFLVLFSLQCVVVHLKSKVFHSLMK